MKKHLWLAALASLGLAACGGGGGGGDDDGAPAGAASAGSDVSSTNYTALAAPVARTLLSVNNGSAIGLVTTLGDDGTARAAAATAPGFPAVASPAPWAVFALRHVAGRPAGRAQAQAVYSYGEACPLGGSISATIDDVDDNDDLNRGDTVTAGFDNCVVEPGLPAVQGTLSMQVNSVRFNRDDEITALDVNAMLTNFGAVGYDRLTGASRIRFEDSGNGIRLRLGYDGLRAVNALQTVVYDFEVDTLVSAGTGVFTISGTIGLDGQTYVIESTQDFRASDGNPPHTGVLRLADAAGDALKLVPRSSSLLDFEFHPAGATAPAHTTPNQAWSAFKLF
ncbi:hypothetical protein V4F39_22865 [Aquincola sp. MAHUQ-54]|uniref:Uncharacterized protein n=1 Tax=Aquincola agrisoli TaxID=3119538 RepID=A0AAW9QMX8_9BURK